MPIPLAQSVHGPQTIEFTVNPNGRYGFLSNYAHSPLQIPYCYNDRLILIHTQSVEAEIQAVKYDALPTDNVETQKLKTLLQHAIRSASTAMEASMLGRDDARCHDVMMSCRVHKTLQPFRQGMVRPRHDWNQIQDACMVFLLRKKFEFGHFRAQLLRTGDARLVFHCPRDLYWGTNHGAGENRLGEMLMAIRMEIRYELYEEAQQK